MPEQKRRDNCRSYSRLLVVRGVLKPEPCKNCGGNAEKHHPDYDNPRLIVWLCRRCHLDLHLDKRDEMRRNLAEFAAKKLKECFTETY